MWVFTQSGFVSAVRHYDQPAIVVVRARDRESLQDLAASVDAPIEKSPSNDYPYRVHVGEREFSEWLVRAVADLDYHNFKDRVHDTRGHVYADALLRVWGAMHDVEDDDARTGR